MNAEDDDGRDQNEKLGQKQAVKQLDYSGRKCTGETFMMNDREPDWETAAIMPRAARPGRGLG